MKNNNRFGRKFLRTTALVCALLLSLLCFSSCKARRLSPTEGASRSVGSISVLRMNGTSTVYEVPYEEFYFLAKTYEDSVDAEKGSDEYDRALMTLISDNITANYAILALCEDMGLVYDEKELRDEVSEEVEAFIDESFGGSRKEYLSALADIGLTDNCHRFMLGVDCLYNQLPLIYSQKGLVPTHEGDIIKYIKANYICTKHIVIFNDEGEDPEENLANAERARQLLLEGRSINDLIGGKPINVNEDLLIPFDGYYFSKGTMDKEYENAAFGLEVGGVSEIVRSRAQNNYGKYVDCYYVIQRMELDDEYIDKHLNDLSDDIAASVIAGKLDTLRDALEFVPNEYCLSLELSALEPCDAGIDITAITVACVFGILTLITAIFVIVFVYVRNKKIAEARALKEKRK